MQPLGPRETEPFQSSRSQEMATDSEKGRNGLGFAKVDQEPRVYGSRFAVKGSVRRGISQGREGRGW